MRWTSLFTKKPSEHEIGNSRCPQCPDHWPLEHKNCGGLFHANQISEITRAVACDKCGLKMELVQVMFQGNPNFPPEDARQLERMILDKATSERLGTTTRAN